MVSKGRNAFMLNGHKENEDMSNIIKCKKNVAIKKAKI